MKYICALLLFSVVLYSKMIIGLYENITLIDFDNLTLVSKIDTGAKTSSIHVDSIEQSDSNHIKVKIANNTKEFKISRIAEVKSSNGISQKRYFIYMNINIGNQIFKEEFSLVNRKNMKYKVLIGRNILEKDFLIDVNK